MKAIVAALNGGEAADKLWTDGLHVGGERYVVFKVEGRSIYGRKVRIPPYPLYPIAHPSRQSSSLSTSPMQAAKFRKLYSSFESPELFLILLRTHQDTSLQPDRLGQKTDIPPGQRRRRDRQNHASDPGRPLRRGRDRRQRCHDRRAAGRLPRQARLLEDPYDTMRTTGWDEMRRERIFVDAFADRVGSFGLGWAIEGKGEDTLRVWRGGREDG